MKSDMAGAAAVLAAMTALKALLSQRVAQRLRIQFAQSEVVNEIMCAFAKFGMDESEFVRILVFQRDRVIVDGLQDVSYLPDIGKRVHAC